MALRVRASQVENDRPIANRHLHLHADWLVGDTIAVHLSDSSVHARRQSIDRVTHTALGVIEESHRLLPRCVALPYFASSSSRRRVPTLIPPPGRAGHPRFHAVSAHCWRSAGTYCRRAAFAENAHGEYAVPSEKISRDRPVILPGVPRRRRYGAAIVAT